MKRIACFVLCLLPGLAASAMPAPGRQKVETPVEKVTLFIDGAQVTRTREVRLPAGSSTVVFTGLSPYLDDKSMQVSARGKFTVTGVNRLFNYTDSLERSSRQRELEQAFARTERQKKKLAAAREVIEAEHQLLKTNCSVSNRNVATPLAAIRELNDYYISRLQVLKQKTLDLDEQAESLDKEALRLRSELAQLGRPPVPMSEVEVRIEAPAACTASFTLTYYVRNAGWFPSYDIRSGGLAEPVEISYKANLFQNTGEEWTDVALTLSSSNPNTGNIAPELKTYWLDYGLSAPRYGSVAPGSSVSGSVYDTSHEPMAGVTVMVPGSTVGTTTDIDGRYSLTIPNGAKQLQFSFLGCENRTLDITGNVLNVILRQATTRIDEVVVRAYGTQGTKAMANAAPQMEEVSLLDMDIVPGLEVAQAQTRLGYEFEIKQPYTVGSDGKAVAAEIGRYALPAVYTYYGTPKIDKDAFLVAETTDWAKLNLLAGEANVYFENTFVGKSILDPTQAGDTLRFSMGRDRSIRIERTKLVDYISRRFIGSNQTQTMAWQFTVRNTRTEPAVVVLSDQLPVSRNSTITVTAEELSGGYLDKKSGQVTWRLELQPGEQRELRLVYGVKYPRGRILDIE